MSHLLPNLTNRGSSALSRHHGSAYAVECHLFS